MSTVKGSGSRSGMKGSSKANQSSIAQSKMRSTRVGKSTIGGPGARRPSVDASTPAVFDPEDGTDRTPVPLTAAAVAAAAAAAAAKAQGATQENVMVSGMGMNSQAMTSGMGLSSALGSEMTSGQGASVQGSLGFSSQGGNSSAANKSQMSGSHFSSLGGSVLSQMSQGSQASGSDRDGVSSLTRKAELPTARDVMRAQLNFELSQLKEDDLDADHHFEMRETDMFMILDIKSVKCRNSDEGTLAIVEGQNEAYATVKENKITAADNYAQRGVKTTNPVMMTKNVQENAPSSLHSSFQACEWDIYDHFFDPNAEEEEEFNAEEELKGAEGAVGEGGEIKAVGKDGNPGQSQMSGDVSTIMGGASEMNSVGMSSMAMGSVMQSGMNSIMVSGMGPSKVVSTHLPEDLCETMRVLERMVMQNIYAVNHLQYSGFDLPSELKEALADNEEKDEDESEEDDEEWSDDDEISYRLDSQWNYECELTKGCNVSSMSWSKKPKYEHVLAVSYGETDFESAQKGGAILLWSLKNPEHPDHVIETHSGVMCVAFSHTHHNLLAAGMYDGTVCVYDIGRRDSKPMMECIYTQKHTGPVWELRWVDQNSERGEKIVSISSDGRITQWTMKKGLEHTDLFKLKKVPNPAKQKDVKSEAFISRNASGFCFDFSPADSELYLCGTEEGNIHLCSRLYNHFLRTYVGHTEPVYKVKYCPAHPGIFISASADWTLKIWSTESTKCLMSIQPGNTPVMDVCWSPAKTTVFGATTADGKLLVYDLDQNATESSCRFSLEDQSVHMNSLAFGEDSPVVMAGTSAGTVATFTIHGLSSAMSGGIQVDPVKQLETILMMDKEAVVAGDDATVEA